MIAKLNLISIVMLAAFAPVQVVYAQSGTDLVYPDGKDHNGDGILDEVYYYLERTVVRVYLDRNFDGQIDSKGFLSYKTGTIEYSLDDNDFNGIFETRVNYNSNGTARKVFVDSDENGSDDHISEYKHGVLQSLTIMSDDLGSVTYKYHLNKLVGMYLDSDGDGEFEEECEVDFLERQACP